MKSISISFASSFPSSLSFSCASNLSNWSIGSLSSVYALANSFPAINNSNLSTNLGSSGFFFVSGDISNGCPYKNVG